MNNKVKNILLMAIIFVSLFTGKTFSQTEPTLDKQAIIDSLTTINPDVKKYFPRWKICEPDCRFKFIMHFYQIMIRAY